MLCTVKKTFEIARDTGNSLVVQVKANQQTLHAGIEAICAAETPIDSAETVDRNRHDRQEHRRVETFEVTGRLGPDWDDLITTAVRVTRLTWHKDTRTGLWRETCEAALYAWQIRLSAAAIGDARRGGRKRSVDVREVVNGLMHVLGTGCQRRAVPKDLPPRSTLHGYLELWEWDGTLARIHHALYVKCREQASREASPTAAIIDTQSVKRAEKGGLDRPQW